MTLKTVSEDNGNLNHLQALTPKPMGHLNLKAVTVRADLLEFDGFQRPSTETFVTTGRIGKWHSGDDLDIFSGALAQHQPTQRPVDHANSIEIPRAEHQIGALSCFEEHGNIVRIM